MKSNHKYRIGQRVRIINDDCCGWDIGSICIIKECAGERSYILGERSYILIGVVDKAFHRGYHVNKTFFNSDANLVPVLFIDVIDREPTEEELNAI